VELEIRHLRIVCAVAEAGSLTRAAAALRLTQPGLSAQLQRIEATLGARLFTRSPNGAVPTALGEVVLARARAVLPAMDDLARVTALAARTGQAPSRVRIGTINTPLIGGVLDAVRRLRPQAEVCSRLQGSPLPLIADLAEGRLEIAAVGDNPGFEITAPAEVVLTPVLTEPVFVALPATHPMADAATVNLADLQHEDWVAPPADADRTREYHAATLASTGRTLRTVHEAEGRVVMELVRSGHALSLCQPTFPESPGIAVRPITGDPLWYRYLLAWHAAGPFATDEAAATLMACVQAAYQGAVGRSPTYRQWLAARDGVSASDDLARS
jgi:DNA-binding transcriptional LysR family regulator